MKPNPVAPHVKRYNRAVDRMFKALDRFEAEATACGIPVRRVVYAVVEPGMRTFRITSRANAKGSK